MPVRVDQPFYRPPRPLSRTLDRVALLRQSGVNFIPIGNGRTIRTSPLIEDNSVSWRERYVEAALIYLTNPLCFAAQSVINDELADARIVVEEKVGTKWKIHEDNPLIDWIQHPNPMMDVQEFIRAYSTHLHTFGGVYSFMFQPNDIFPNGKINQKPNCLDIIFPGRIAEDTVSNPYGIDWWYLPMGYEEPLKLSPESLFVDVLYNPLAHNLGVSLPNSPLDIIFAIHKLYMQNVKRFFDIGAVPTHLLTRMVDITKEASAMGINDEQIEEAVQRIYNQVGRQGRRPNGILGLRGDWRVTRLGSPLPELMNKDLLQYIDALISGVYKIPPSLFWAGMQSSNQRASRQQDSIDFYNMKIRPLLIRITSRLSHFLVPKFIKEPKSGKQTFRIGFDVSEMPLAQYAVTKQYRMYERWYQLRLIQRGTFLNYVNEPTTDLTDEELNEWYSGSNNSNGMNIGAGDQPIEGGAGGNGLE
jgi:hypothetical protein